MPANSTPERLAGLVERVVFHNEENGFCVLRLQCKGHRDLVTIVGAAASVNAGEWAEAEGRWVQDREFGRQFRADTLKCTPPSTLDGMQRYLGSGLIKGIGPVYAQKMVEAFGDQIFAVIDGSSARLEEIDGIGPKRRRRIKDAWEEQKAVRAIMVFLHSHGVGTSRAVRIHRVYGDQAIDRIRENPYVLARDIPGIGFKTADEIARRIGIPHDSVARAEAGLSHVLLEATHEGHCALPEDLLLERAQALLSAPLAVVQSALARGLQAEQLVADRVGDERMIFTARLHFAETWIARRVRELASGSAGYPPIDVPKAIAWCEQRTGQTLAPSQRQALEAAVTHRCLIITGGPGVGKTTLVNAILSILRAKKVAALLCAPTGRAAKRLTETTGEPAQTIHRLLEVNPAAGTFTRNEHNRLDCDLLVVDECSMVDVALMSHLLRALPDRAGLLLVGDVDQLPSVGPGCVLQHLIQSGVLPVARLTEVFRQASQSRIITNAHRVNAGELPNTDSADADADFHFVERHEPERILQTLLEMVQNRIPRRFGLDPIRDIQVLCPMNRGSLGIRELNVQLQSTLNPAAASTPVLERFGWQFRPRDKVIQMENNYDKEVFNGDIGQIERIDHVEQEVSVRFDPRTVVYDFSELDELALAYAITIHKSQGSEFPAVVIPVATQQYLLLQRNLIYTAMTRGKRLVVLVGQKQALAMAVRNHRTEQRYSGLLSRLTARSADTPGY